MKFVCRSLCLMLAMMLLGACTSATDDGAPAKTWTRSIEHSELLTPKSVLKVENLTGYVSVIAGGDKASITASVVAGGDTDAAAKALADTIQLSVTHDGDNVTVHVDYPVATHDTYRYISNQPEATRGHGINVLGVHISSSTSRSSLTYQGHQVEVYQGSNKGVPLHVDLVVQVPVGSNTHIENHIGNMQAQKLNGNLALSNSWGDMRISDMIGTLSTTTGSGDTYVTNQHGTLTINTGSGDVTLDKIFGDTNVTAGSGDIEADSVQAGSVAISAGSGDIDLKHVSGTLKLSTGSGDVSVADPGAIADAHIQCGSGDIKLRGDLSAMHGFDLSAGSGDISLTTNQPPSMHLDVHADDITVSWPGMRNVQREHGQFSADVGDAGAGIGRITTQSGEVILSH
ncbi:MAG: DUF4097 family beta strand repeat-containing protein [Rudaea sp.]